LAAVFALIELRRAKGEALKTPLLGEEGWIAQRDGVVPFSANWWRVGMTFDTPLLAAGSFISLPDSFHSPIHFIHFPAAGLRSIPLRRDLQHFPYGGTQ
jgi:hypothetical protein